VDDIVTSPADKGSGIVVMDKKEYAGKLEFCEIGNSATYKTMTDDYTNAVQKKVKKIANNLHSKGSISKNVKGYMTTTGGAAGKLQGNPKLHNTGVPLRNIVNGRNHPPEKMAEIVENELRAHVTSLPSYIQNTADFLNKLQKIQQPRPEGTILFCLAVKVLYPSVSRQEDRSARVYPSIPTDDVLAMMDTVLDNNTITFNGIHYIQT